MAATHTGKITIQFWGVRGGIPTPDDATCRFGGNTPCVEIRCGTHLIILDAGTGIRACGAALDQSKPIEADIFFSHTRFERTCGLPFFAPGYNPNNAFAVWAGHASKGPSVETELKTLMTSPLFPIPLSFIGGLKTWHDFVAGDTFSPRPGITVKTARLNHPQGSTGYRIEHGGHAVCYVNSTAHVTGKLDQATLRLIDKADAVIYDSHFFDDEYSRNGASSGHSTWQEGLRLVQAASARRLLTFEHHPDRDDDALDAVQRELDTVMPGSRVAYEGLIVAV